MIFNQALQIYPLISNLVIQPEAASFSPPHTMTSSSESFTIATMYNSSNGLRSCRDIEGRGESRACVRRSMREMLDKDFWRQMDVLSHVLDIVFRIKERGNH